MPVNYKKSMSLFWFLWVQRTGIKINANLAYFLPSQAVNYEVFMTKKMHLFFMILNIMLFLFSGVNMLVFYVQIYG